MEIQEIPISEHELMVGRVLFREKKEMHMVKNSIESEVKTELVHTRQIGDEDYLKVTQTMRNGELVDEKIDSNLESEEAIEDFKKQWENEWTPVLISTDQTQGSTGIADKIKNFFGLN